MKRIVSTFVMAAFAMTQTFAWSGIGHASVAAIAENHLTPKARMAITEYLDGKSIVSIASEADKKRAVWTFDLGFIPTNPEKCRLSWLTGFDFSTPQNIAPWSHSYTVDSNFKPYPTDNLDGEYINNIVYYVDKLSKDLKKIAATMDPEMRARYIMLIVHFLGDMHCPMHVVYLPADPAKGSFPLKFRGGNVKLHSFWDKTMFSECGTNNPAEVARLADTARKGEIRRICKGDVYRWGEDSARKSWAAHTFKEGDTIPDNYIKEMQPLLYSQVRNGGYRLAKVLNDIFD